MTGGENKKQRKTTKLKGKKSIKEGKECKGKKVNSNIAFIISSSFECQNNPEIGPIPETRNAANP